MTVWIVIEGTSPENLQSRIDAVRTAYTAKKVRGRDNPGEDEKIGAVALNRTKTKAFTGTTRGRLVDLVGLAVEHAPWVTVTDDPGFMRDAEWDPEP